MIEFSCVCGWELSVGADWAGRKAKCPGCAKMVQVPIPPERPKPGPGAEPVEVIKIVSSAGPWKIVSGVAGAIAAALLGVLILGGRGGASADLEALEARVAGLKKDLERRDAELDELKDRRSDPGNSETLARRVKELEADREGLRKDLAQSRTEVAQLRAQLPASRPAAAPEAGLPAQDPTKPAETAPKPREPKGPAAVELVQRCLPPVVSVRTNLTTGAGFFITPDGLVVTNYHVIARSAERKVAYFEGEGKDRTRREVEAEVFAIDAKNNLALLKASVRGLVPVVTLERPGTVCERDQVLLIGLAVRDADANDPPSLLATIGNLSRDVYGTNCIETTLPVPDEFCGAAVFGAAGKVVAVATSRGIEGEKTGLAIPVSYLHELIEKKETVYAVRGPLAAWEAKQDTRASYDTSKGIKIEGNVVKIQIDEENNRILCLDAKNHNLVVVSLSQRKILRSIPTGSEPSDFQVSPKPDIAWVSHGTTRSLVKVDVAEGKAFDRIDVGAHFHRFVATRNHVWTYGVRTTLFPLKDKKPLACPLKFGAMAYDRRRDRVVGLVTNWTDQKLVEFDPDKVGPLLRDIIEISEAGPSGPRWKELDDLNKELMKQLKSWSIPAEYWDWSANSMTFSLIADGSQRIYFNQAVLKQDKMDSILGFVRPDKYTRWNDPMAQDAARLVGLHDRIIAGSPDGRWIANATHIYDGEKFVVYKELPIPAAAMAFTGDSKTLFFFDAVNQLLVPLDVETKSK